MASKEAIREYLKTKWQEHKAAFRIEPAGTDNSRAGIGIVRNDGQLLECTFVLLHEQGRLRAWQATLGIELANKKMSVLAEASEHDPQGARPLDLRDTISWLGLDGSDPDIARQSVVAFRNTIDDQEALAQLDRIFDDLKKSESARLEKAGGKTLREWFVPEALRVLDCVEHPRWADYSFYASMKYGATRREQGQLFPMIADALARRPALRQTIDDGAPLKPALQQGLGLSKGIQKRIQGRAFAVHGMDGTMLARNLAQIQPDWVPSSEAQWSAFLDVASVVGPNLVDALGLSPDDLYKGSKGDWVAFRRNLAKSATDTRPPENLDEENFERLKRARDWKRLTKMDPSDVPAEIERMTDGLDLPDGVGRDEFTDWLNRVYAPPEDQDSLQIAAWDATDVPAEFAKTVIVPLIANTLHNLSDTAYVIDEGTRSKAFQVAVDMLFRGKSAPAILEASRGWHNDRFNMLANLADQDADEAYVPPQGEWPALTAPAQAPNGVWLVPLTTRQALQQEGHALWNCVGGYWDRCQRGQHIVSVRTYDQDGNPNRLSVAQISQLNLEFDRPHETIRSHQHRGYRNGTPNGRAKTALNWYTDAIRTGRLAINLREIVSFNRPTDDVQQWVRDRVQDECGYDWRDRDNVAEALQTWSPYLAKRYRRMTAEQLVDNVPEVYGMIKSIEPQFHLLRASPDHQENPPENNRALAYG